MYSEKNKQTFVDRFHLNFIEENTFFTKSYNIFHQIEKSLILNLQSRTKHSWKKSNNKQTNVIVAGFNLNLMQNINN